MKLSSYITSWKLSAVIFSLSAWFTWRSVLKLHNSPTGLIFSCGARYQHFIDRLFVVWVSCCHVIVARLTKETFKASISLRGKWSFGRDVQWKWILLSQRRPLCCGVFTDLSDVFITIHFGVAFIWPCWGSGLVRNVNFVGARHFNVSRSDKKPTIVYLDDVSHRASDFNVDDGDVSKRLFMFLLTFMRILIASSADD